MVVFVGLGTLLVWGDILGDDGACMAPSSSESYPESCLLRLARLALLGAPSADFGLRLEMALLMDLWKPGLRMMEGF